MPGSRTAVKNGQNGPAHPATKHGAKAVVLPARVSDKARAIAAELAVAAPVRDSDGQLPVHDQEVVRQLATILCRLESINEYIEKHGVINKRTGKPHSAAVWERRLQSHALKFMKELGMTPQSRAKLGLNLARTVDLATAMSEPDPDRRTKLLQQAGLDVDGDE